MWKAILFLAGGAFAGAASAQSSVGALGGADDAAQRLFQGGMQVPADTVWDAASVEVQPEYPGGDSAMYSYLQQAIVYPAGGGDEALEGKVFLQFIVRGTGLVDQVQVLRHAHPALDAEAVRAVRAMPAWKPGEMHGKPVDTRLTLPVVFTRN